MDHQPFFFKITDSTSAGESSSLMILTPVFRDSTGDYSNLPWALCPALGRFGHGRPM